jgi:hypothetical protein
MKKIWPQTTLAADCLVFLSVLHNILKSQCRSAKHKWNPRFLLGSPKTCGQRRRNNNHQFPVLTTLHTIENLQFGGFKLTFPRPHFNRCLEAWWKSTRKHSRKRRFESWQHTTNILGRTRVHSFVYCGKHKIKRKNFLNKKLILLT